jgi:hypothetical protein
MLLGIFHIKRDTTYLKSVWLCLCSERATFVVGSALAIDGGYLA